MTRNNADFQGGVVANDHLTNPNDYVTLHRGIGHNFWNNGLPTSPEHFQGLGEHWTTDYRVAGHFATGDPDALGGRDNPEDGGHIITARVHKSGIIERGSSEWHEIAQDKRIEGAHDDEPSEGAEKEVTVRPGTPLHVIRVTPVKDFDEVAPQHLRNALEYPAKNPFVAKDDDFIPFLVNTEAKRGSYLKKGSGTA